MRSTLNPRSPSRAAFPSSRKCHGPKSDLTVPVFDVLKCASRDSLIIVLPLLRSLEQAAAVLGETMLMNTQQFAIVCEPLETTFALRSV